jgi:hypothetical protein
VAVPQTWAVTASTAFSSRSLSKHVKYNQGV